MNNDIIESLERATELISISIDQYLQIQDEYPSTMVGKFVADLQVSIVAIEAITKRLNQMDKAQADLLSISLTDLYSKNENIRNQINKIAESN